MQDTSRIFDGKLLDGASKTRKIPLNLVYDYPVRWSKYKVLRDFVQNFYDSIGYRAWNSRFKYRYKSGKLSMKAQDVSFSYEWLVPIGSSTKRDGSNAYASYFGERFKIASLNALREYNVPAVYDIFLRPETATQFQGAKKCGEVWRGNERSE